MVTVATHLPTTGPALFISDQWNNEFVHFLLDNIENPPDSDIEDEIPDVFVNTLLSFNQHFEGMNENIIYCCSSLYKNTCVCVCVLMYIV